MDARSNFLALLYEWGFFRWVFGFRKRQQGVVAQRTLVRAASLYQSRMRVLVVGGGLSGLSIGHFLRKGAGLRGVGLELTIMEKERFCGGAARRGARPRPLGDQDCYSRPAKRMAQDLGIPSVPPKRTRPWLFAPENQSAASRPKLYRLPSRKSGLLGLISSRIGLRVLCTSLLTEPLIRTHLSNEKLSVGEFVGRRYGTGLAMELADAYIGCAHGTTVWGSIAGTAEGRYLRWLEARFGTAGLVAELAHRINGVIGGRRSVRGRWHAGYNVETHFEAEDIPPNADLTIGTNDSVDVGGVAVPGASDLTASLEESLKESVLSETEVTRLVCEPDHVHVEFSAAGGHMSDTAEFDYVFVTGGPRNGRAISMLSRQPCRDTRRRAISVQNLMKQFKHHSHTLCLLEFDDASAALPALAGSAGVMASTRARERAGRLCSAHFEDSNSVLVDLWGSGGGAGDTDSESIDLALARLADVVGAPLSLPLSMSVRREWVTEAPPDAFDVYRKIRDESAAMSHSRVRFSGVYTGALSPVEEVWAAERQVIGFLDPSRTQSHVPWPGFGAELHELY